jgi:hypothetical protein
MGANLDVSEYLRINLPGTIEKYKVQLVTNGYTRKEDEGFFDTY